MDYDIRTSEPGDKNLLKATYLRLGNLTDGVSQSLTRIESGRGRLSIHYLVAFVAFLLVYYFVLGPLYLTLYTLSCTQNKSFLLSFYSQ